MDLNGLVAKVKVKNVYSFVCKWVFIWLCFNLAISIVGLIGNVTGYLLVDNPSERCPSNCLTQTCSFEACDHQFGCEMKDLPCKCFDTLTPVSGNSTFTNCDAQFQPVASNFKIKEIAFITFEVFMLVGNLLILLNLFLFMAGYFLLRALVTWGWISFEFSLLEEGENTDEQHAPLIDGTAADTVNVIHMV